MLASTQQLHDKVKQMSDRIQALEDALRLSHDCQSKEAHPLLTRELLAIKSGLDLHSAARQDAGGAQREEEEGQPLDDAFGTLAINTGTGSSTFYGRSAGSESLLMNEKGAAFEDSNPILSRGKSADITMTSPYVALQLPSSFPFSSLSNVSLEELIERHIPPWEEALRYTQLYTAIAPWFYGAVSVEELEEEILPRWFPEARQHGGNVSATSPSEQGSAHNLALLFMIICFGALTDTSLPAAPNNNVAEHYYRLTKAAMSLEPATDRPPTFATVQTLSMMGIYQGLCNTDNSIESMWTLFGLSTKLAQSIGLHKDSARWKLPPHEVQKRRALFWELFITDGWQSLSTGRLATFSLPFVDCELPQDKHQTFDAEGKPQPSFPYWKARFGMECVSAIVNGTLTARAPTYSVIIELDRKVRDMELPQYAQGEPPTGCSLRDTMMFFMPHIYRDLSLLYIHRCFFAHALVSHPLDPLKSQYAPSFLAGYRSSTMLIGNLKISFRLFPHEIARFWVLWTHAFSGAIMLASIVTHAPKSKVARAALLEMKSTTRLFQEAAELGGRATRFAPILVRLIAKAEKTFKETSEGIPPPTEKDIFAPKVEDTQDELSIFSGKTSTVVHSDSRPAISSPPAPQPESSRSNLPDGISSLIPAFANAHPGLLNDYREFESAIDQRLQEAQMDSPEQTYAASQSSRPHSYSSSQTPSDTPSSHYSPDMSSAESTTSYHHQYQHQHAEHPYSDERRGDHQSRAAPNSAPLHQGQLLSSQGSSHSPSSEVFKSRYQESRDRQPPPLAHPGLEQRYVQDSYEQERYNYASTHYVATAGPDVRYHYSHMHHPTNYNPTFYPPEGPYRQMSTTGEYAHGPYHTRPHYTAHAPPPPWPPAGYQAIDDAGYAMPHPSIHSQPQDHSGLRPPSRRDSQLMYALNHQEPMMNDDRELQATWNQYNFRHPGAIPGLDQR